MAVKLSVVLSLLSLLLLGCDTTDDASGERSSVVIETCDDPGDGSGSGSGYGDGSGAIYSTCTTCECPDCDNDERFQAAYDEVFGGAGDGSGDGSGMGDGSGAGDGSGTSPTARDFRGEPSEELLEQCFRVSEMTYDPGKWDCKDYAGWFLRCLLLHGVTGEGLNISCENCSNENYENGRIGHRIVVYKRNGKYCPAEPGWGDGEEASGCCNTSKAEAQKCAHERYCDGTWPERETPSSSKEDCTPLRRSSVSCSTCMSEQCTPEQREQVCEILDIEEDALDRCIGRVLDHSGGTAKRACGWCCANNSDARKVPNCHDRCAAM